MTDENGMLELEHTNEKWRMSIMRINMLLVVFGFFIELAMYFVLAAKDLINQPLSDYFTWFLAIPTILNVIIIVIGRWLIKTSFRKSRWNNYLPVVQLAAICTVFAAIHNIFSVTLCFFCFSQFISTTLNDRRMVRHMAVLNFFFLLIALSFRRFWIYRPKNDEYFLPEAIVALAILLATIVFSEMLIGFQEQRTYFINMGLCKQIEMQDQLNRDQKTDLYGQTLFINTLRKMVECGGTPVQLAVIDIDDFKKVNDSYGHLMGDKIILQLADLMRETFPQRYFLSRYGGEEFTIISKIADVEAFAKKLEKLRSSFEKQKYEGIAEAVTISIGVAELKNGWSAEELFEAADQAMYMSKREGKNRITVFRSEQSL